MLHDFNLRGRRVRLWQRTGESYAHVWLKAVGYAMFVDAYPQLEIERAVGLRYKPDLVAPNAAGDGFDFWGECGANSLRKTMWLLKHARVRQLVLFKLERVEQLIAQLRAEIAPRYRADGRLRIIVFAPEIIDRTADRSIHEVPADWYQSVMI